MWFVGLPLLAAFIGQLPLLESLDHPINVMLLGLKFADGIRCMGRHQQLVALCRDYSDRHMPVGTVRDILFELIQDLEIFVGDLKDGSPNFFPGRWYDTRETASPLRRPAAELNAVLGEIGWEEKFVFGGAALELGEVQIIRVEEELH